MQPRARLLLLLFTMNLINFIDRVNITIVAPVILKDLGWDKATLGSVMSATLLGYAAGQLPAGLLVDRFGGFVLLAVLCSAWSLATALTPAVFGTFGLLLAMRFLLGFFESANNPAQTALNSRAFPPSELARAQGLCFSGTQVGPLLGSPVIAWLVSVYPWSYVFYGCAALGLLWVLVWIAAAPRVESGAAAARIASSTTSVASSANAAPVARGSAARRVSNGLVLAPPVLALSLAGLLWGYAMWVFVSWFPTYLFDTWRFSMKELGWVNTIPTLGGIASIIGGGFVSDWLIRRGFVEGRARKLLAGCGLAGSAACITGAVLAPSAALSVAAFTMNGFIQGLAVAPFYSLPAVLAPRAAGTIAATLNFCMAVGGVASPYIAGFLRDRTGDWLAAFASAGACNLAAGLVILALVRAERLPGED
jgi:ACS family hexuronate transporter-like MFS transporter